MSGALDVGSDVVAAGSALAGFILVYLGAVATDFSTFPPQHQRAVRAMFVRRAWFAFPGIIFSLAATAAAIVAKMWNAPDLAGASVILLMIALLWATAVALLAVLDVR